MAVKDVEYIDPNDLIIIGHDTDDRPGEIGERTHVLYDERAFLSPPDELVANILAYGVQKPVIIRKEAGKKYVVDGRQRTKAAREAAKRQADAGQKIPLKVPCMEVKGDDARMAGLMISLNEFFEQDTVLIRAQKLVRFLDLVGNDYSVAAIAFGKSVTTLKNWVTLISQGDPLLHAALREKKISAGAAIELAKMPRDEQLAALDKHLAAADGGMKMAEEKAKKAKAKKKAETEVEAGASGTSNGSAWSEGELPADLENPPNKKKGEKLTTAKAKKLKEKALGIDSGSPSKAAAAPGKQAGIKRSWLRRALKTKAAAELKPDQKAVLEWFVSGEADRGMWFDDFRFDAEMELSRGSAVEGNDSASTAEA